MDSHDSKSIDAALYSDTHPVVPLFDTAGAPKLPPDPKHYPDALMYALALNEWEREDEAQKAENAANRPLQRRLVKRITIAIKRLPRIAMGAITAYGNSSMPWLRP
jgi:hypothetical protein